MRSALAALGALRSADTVVLGLPRGGVPVAARVATALGAPLDVIVVCKLGAPMQPELAVGAVVCCGGRPDLAQDRLQEVTAPTLMLFGSDDRTVVELNRRAAGAMHCEHRVQVVTGATHLFEEPGALERVAEEAAQWFRTRLAVPAGTG